MSETSSPPPTQPTGGLSRRTLVKGAAWSVPAIAVASAAPAYAASNGCTPMDVFTAWQASSTPASYAYYSWNTSPAGMQLPEDVTFVYTNSQGLPMQLNSQISAARYSGVGTSQITITILKGWIGRDPGGLDIGMKDLTLAMGPAAIKSTPIGTYTCVNPVETSVLCNLR